MKNIFKTITLAILLLCITPFISEASFVYHPKKAKLISAQDSLTIADNNIRLSTIATLQHGNISKAQKKELRIEANNIKKKSAKLSGGVYISAGALILILILLIILL